MSNTTVETGYDVALPDLDVNENSEATPGTMLTALREEGKRKISLDPINLKVPGRPDMVFVYDVNIDSTVLDTWRKRATTTKRGRTPEFDGLKFAKIIMASQCRNLIYRNVDMGMTFTSKELQETFKATSYFDCIKFVYGNDADIFRHGNEIITAAGYGDQADLEEVDEDEDPMVRS